MFHAGSCGTCHRAGGGKAGPAHGPALPTGGAPLKTPVGTFFPGNLTPDPATGLGRFTESDFVDAMTRGLSPDGRHYFPAFPYASYRGMSTADLLDLYSYLRSLPAVSSPGRLPTVPLAPLARRGVGLWKRLAFASPAPGPPAGASPVVARGAYLVEGIGHCGECHTPRNLFMVSDRSRLLAGAPHPAGEGIVPSLDGLVARGKYKDAADLASALRDGETLGYDHLSSGGMGAIQENLSKLPENDLRAIAEYLADLR
jgi:mono/diheme cytochrome c family protein